MPDSNALVLIPARMAATRFPGKPLADIDGTLKSFKANGCTPNSTNPTCVKLKLGIDKKAVTYYNKYGPSQSAAAADILRSLWDGSVESFSKVKGSSVGALVGEGSAEEQCPCSCTPENAAHCEDICEAEKMACDRGKGDPLSAAYTSLRNLSRAVALHRKAKLMAEAGRDLVKDIKRNETESQIKMLGLIGDRLRTVRPARPGGNLWDTHESSGGLKQKGASKTQGGWGQPFQSAANKGASR